MTIHLSTARFAAVLALSAALLTTGVVAGAAGATMIIGSETNNAGSANTQLLTNSSVVAFKLLQNGPGTALMGYTTTVTGTTRGVYGRVDSPNGDGIQGRNAGPAGTGAAFRGYGGENAGAVLSSDADYPLELVGPVNVAPMTVNSSIKVANLNADQLDGKTSTDFLLNGTVTGHFPCAGFAMDPREGGTTATDCSMPGSTSQRRPRLADLQRHASGRRNRGRRAGPRVRQLSHLPGGLQPFGNQLCRWVRHDDGCHGGHRWRGDARLRRGRGRHDLQPVIDNSAFAYVGQCALGGNGSGLRVHGFWVEYTISGLPVV